MVGIVTFLTVVYTGFCVISVNSKALIDDVTKKGFPSFPYAMSLILKVRNKYTRIFLLNQIWLIPIKHVRLPDFIFS